MRVEQADEYVTKTAESEDDRARLGSEAAVLAAVAHPGVVRVARLEGARSPERPDRLILHRVGGSSLDSLGPRPAGAVAGWGAAVATVLADLHALGYVHGDIRSEHVIIDDHGRPVLCGFGRSRPVEGPEAKAACEADVRSLAQVLGDHLQGGETPLRRLLSSWAAGRQRGRSDARALARSLVEHVPASDAGRHGVGRHGVGRHGVGRHGVGRHGVGRHGVGSPEPDGPPAESRPRWRPPGPRTGTSRRWASVAAGAGALGLGLVAGLLFRLPAGGGAPRTVDAAVPAYVVRSAPGQVPLAVLGRWGCGRLRPAVLDARSGSVWVFRSWPGRGGTAPGALLTRVPAAIGLGVATAGTDCDRLVVLRAGLPELAVTVPGDQ